MEQIILSQSTTSQFKESLKLFEYQDLIFNKWGFKQIEPNYKIALNFFGPPGTGKTMMAHAIAHYMHKKIIAVDYAQIESKFVGDAPKNLEAAFKIASDKDAILFFDEADSFLGKRISGISTGSEQAINSLRSQMLL
ncbi:AAA family ATPase [Desulfococcaceae bacterium HSG9]|nr:AAA family ATPase [Desulfococcaceae bacterium HSG9]